MNSSFVIGSDSFTSKLLKCWTEFLSVRKSLRGKPDNQNYSEISKEFTEAEITNVIRVTLNDLISPSHTKSVDFHEVIAYYFFKALLISDKNIENESGDSVTDEIQENSQTVILFRETFYTELFSKIDCILEILLKEVSSNAMEHPVSCMCVAIGLISDLIKDPSLTSLSLYHLEEMWHKFGAFIKKLIEHIMVNQNGIANNDQDVFLFDIFRLWRSSLKAYAEIDNRGMKGTETSAFTVLLGVIHVCLVEHFKVYSKYSIEVPSSLWSNYLVRSLRTVYKLINNSDHLWIHNLYPTADTIIYELLSSYTSCPSKSNTSSPCSSVSHNSLVNYLTSIMKTRKAQGFNEVAVFEIDPGLPLRIIILCGLESISKLDSNNPRFWSSLSSLHKLILDMELYRPGASTDHIYEDSIISLLSEDDSQLFRALDLWIQIEDRAVSVDKLSNKTSINSIPNAHWLFASLAKCIDFSSYLFVDWLISPETTCLSYLVHYLRRICAENQNVHQRLEYSLKNAILFNSWPLEQLTNMLSQIAKCLKTLNESEAIAFCPKPLINRINYCLFILNNISRVQNNTDTLTPSR